MNRCVWRGEGGKEGGREGKNPWKNPVIVVMGYGYCYYCGGHFRSISEAIFLI